MVRRRLARRRLACRPAAQRPWKGGTWKGGTGRRSRGRRARGATVNWQPSTPIVKNGVHSETLTLPAPLITESLIGLVDGTFAGSQHVLPAQFPAFVCSRRDQKPRQLAAARCASVQGVARHPVHVEGRPGSLDRNYDAGLHGQTKWSFVRAFMWRVGLLNC